MHVFFKGLLILILSSSIHFTQAQTSQAHVFTDADTAALSEAMQPEAADAQLTSQESQAIRDSLSKLKYAVERLKNIVSFKKDLLWGDEIYSAIENFEDSTYIQIIPSVIVQDRGALIGIVNHLGLIIDGNPIAPYVRVTWILTPVQSMTQPYRLTVRIEHSPEISVSLVETIRVQLDSVCANKTYTSITASSGDVTNAMELLLTRLGNELGTSLAPHYLLLIQNNTYSSGHSIQVLATEESADSILTIDVYDRINNTIVQDGINWSGAQTNQYGNAYVSTSAVMNHQIKAYLSDDTLSFTVRVWSSDFREQLLSVTWTLLDVIISETLLSMENNLRIKQRNLDSLRGLMQTQHEQNLQARNEVNLGNNGGSTSGPSEFISISTTPQLHNAPSTIETKPVIGNYKRLSAQYASLIGAVHFLRENRQALLRLTQGNNFQQFKNLIEEDIGTMSANAIVQYLSGGRDALKTYLSNYLIQHLTEATSE